MTVQELFKSLDKNDFIKYYCQYEQILANKYSTTDSGRLIIEELFDKLISSEPIENKDDCIVFCIPELGSISYSSYHVYKKDLLEPAESGYVEHYGLDFVPMLETLGYKVSDACLFYLADPRQIAASILYEMTYFGYTIEDQKDESSTLLDSLTIQVEEIQKAEDKGESIVAPIEEVFERVGWVDTRTNSEKLYQEKFSTIEGTCGIDLRDLLYEMERDYINNKI